MTYMVYAHATQRKKHPCFLSSARWWHCYCTHLKEILIIWHVSSSPLRLPAVIGPCLRASATFFSNLHLPHAARMHGVARAAITPATTRTAQQRKGRHQQAYISSSSTNTTQAKPSRSTRERYDGRR